MTFEMFLSIVAVLGSIVTMYVSLRRIAPESRKLELDGRAAQLKLISDYEKKIVDDASIIKSLNSRVDELEKCLAEIQQRMAELEERTEEAQHSAMVRYKALMSITPVPIFVVNVDTGVIVDVNPRTCDLYGYTEGQLKQMNISEVSAEPAQTMEILANRITRVPKRRHRKKNGKIFDVSTEMRYFQDGDNYCVSVVTVLDGDE